MAGRAVLLRGRIHHASQLRRTRQGREEPCSGRPKPLAMPVHLLRASPAGYGYTVCVRGLLRPITIEAAGQHHIELLGFFSPPPVFFHAHLLDYGGIRPTNHLHRFSIPSLPRRPRRTGKKAIGGRPLKHHAYKPRPTALLAGM